MPVQHARKKGSVGRPPKITRQSIVSAFLGASDNVTFKEIADQLKVSKQALRRHVSGLTDIVDMAAEDVAGQYPFPPDSGGNWFQWAYECAYVLKGLYENVPNLAAILSPEAIGVVLLRYETSLRVAKRNGFDELTAYWATGLVFEFVRGWVAREMRFGAKRQIRLTQNTLVTAIKQKHQEGLPLLGAALRRAERYSQEQRFDFMLRCSLAGIAHETGKTFALAKPRKPKRARKRRALP